MAAPQHPGRILAKRLREAGISANRLASDVGIPTNRLTMAMQGERNISADTALRLAHWFGDDPMRWLEMQARYDLYVVGKKIGRALAKMPTQRKCTA